MSTGPVRRWKWRIPLSLKFAVLLGGFVLAMALVIVMNFRTARSIQLDLFAVGESEFPRYAMASALLLQIERVTAGFEAAAQIGEGGFLQQNDAERVRFLSLLDRLVEVTPAAEAAPLAELRTRFDQYYRARRKVTEELLGSNVLRPEIAAQYQPVIGRIAVLESDVHGRVQELERARRNSLRRVLDQITSKTQDQIVRDLVVGAIASFLLILFAWHTARRIVVPIAALSRVTTAVAQGDFDHSAARIRQLGEDEITDLARSFDEMTRGLRETTVSRDYVDSIIVSMADTLLVIGADENILTVNRATLHLLGYRAEELIGQRAALIFPDVESIYVLATRQTLSGTLVRNAEKTYVAKDGRRIPVALSASILFSSAGQMRGYVCLAQDMTERKKTEEALRKANADLAEARDQALAANETKSQFLANMSHELRTPLNAIIGYSEMLLEDAADMGEQSFVDDLGKIRSAGKHLLGLINDVLDISKIEAGKMPLFLEEFEVVPVITEVAEMVQPLVAKNSNQLLLDVPDGLGAIRADMTRVRQVLFNLISNAAKFTKGGIIDLRVAREPAAEGERILFRVRDTGIGMTPEQLGKLFQPFTQAEAGTTRKFGGTGLGLTISLYFCKRMGGDLAVASEYGVGTTFTASIPVRVSEAPEEPPVPVPSRPAADEARTAPGAPGLVAPLVLVIDDDADSRELLARYIVRAGFRVETASNGREGLQLAARIHPDAITLDVMMPDMNGWDVLRTLKADPRLAGLPVIMISMLGEPSLQASGAAAFLRKPVDPSELLATLQKHIHADEDATLVAR